MSETKSNQIRNEITDAVFVCYIFFEIHASIRIYDFSLVKKLNGTLQFTRFTKKFTFEFSRSLEKVKEDKTNQYCP